jgi:hypothetical protein
MVVANCMTKPDDYLLFGKIMKQLIALGLVLGFAVPALPMRSSSPVRDLYMARKKSSNILRICSMACIWTTTGRKWTLTL